MSFWGELKRRNVAKVGIAYAIVAWLIVHPVDIIFPTLHLPEWTTTFVTALFIIGFPFVLIFAWVYEVTPKGLKRTKQVPRAQSITQLTGKKLNYIITGLLIVAVAYIVIDKFYLDRRVSKKEQIPAVGEVAKIQKTIAVLPFVNLSSDPEQEYFVDGLSEEILNSLAQIQSLKVTGRTSSFTFKGSNKKTPEIANELGVENILEGSVRKAGSALRITAQLLRGNDGSHLWSKTYDRKLKDIFVIQEDIATNVVNELKVTLGIGKSFKQLGGTDNLEAYEDFLVAKGLMSDIFEVGEETTEALSAKTSRAQESLDAAITLDPEFALAWSFKALIHWFHLSFTPGYRIDSDLDPGLNAALRAIELEPNLAEAYYSLGLSRFRRSEYIEAELAYRKAMELSYDPMNCYQFGLPLHYLVVGNYERANEIIEAARQIDPLNQTIDSFPVLISGLLGDVQRAEEKYRRSKEIFGDQWFLGNYYITILRLGVKKDITRDDLAYSDPFFDAVVKEHLDSPKEGLAELRRIYNNDDNLSGSNFREISVWAAYFGDLEFAMESMEKAVIKSSHYLSSYWYPVMKEVRQLPRFKEFIKKTGLVDYWNKFGWPDFCHSVGDGDFECD